LKKIGTANALSDEEKQISFLNNYFVFKKVRNVITTDDALENSELKEKEHLAKKAFFDLLKSDTANSAIINTFARNAAAVSFEIDTTTYFYFKK
jgi:hypothetical protein